MTPGGTDLLWVELGKYLGVATPLVAILFYLLRQANQERQALTNAFLKTLTDTVQNNVAMSAQQSAAMAELSEALKDMVERHTAEHKALIESLGWLERWRRNEGRAS